MLTAFAALLYRNSGQRDVRIAVPISSRRHVETEGLIGFFVNTVVIRSELSGAMAAAAAVAYSMRACWKLRPTRTCRLNGWWKFFGRSA